MKDYEYEFNTGFVCRGVMELDANTRHASKRRQIRERIASQFGNGRYKFGNGAYKVVSTSVGMINPSESLWRVQWIVEALEK